MANTRLDFQDSAQSGVSSWPETVDNCAVGDLLVIGVRWYGTQTISSITVTGETAPSPLDSPHTGGPNDGRVQWAVCQVTAAGNKTVTVTWSGTPSAVGVSVWRISGQSATPVDGATVGASGNSTSPSVNKTTSADGAGLFAIAIAISGETTFAAGYTAETVADAFWFDSGAYDLDAGTAGSKTVSGTLPGSGAWVISAIAIAQSAPDPGWNTTGTGPRTVSVLGGGPIGAGDVGFFHQGTISGSPVYNESGSDSLTLVESSTNIASFTRSAADALVLTEQGSSQAVFTSAASEALSFSETANSTASFTRSGSDSLTLADTGTGDVTGGTTYNESASEALTLVESSQTTLAAVGAASEALTLVEVSQSSLVMGVGASETLTLVETATGLVVIALSAVETLSLVEVASGLLAAGASAAEALSLVESGQALLVGGAAGQDTLVFADEGQGTFVIGLAGSDALVFIDSGTGTLGPLQPSTERRYMFIM